ncbi:tripartite tricarboxylate transporter TctB family protein [Thermodesulfobacteriota bacterium]
MKRTYNWGNIAFAVFLGSIVMTMFVTALGYGPKGKAIPLLTGGFTLLMLIITILSELSPKIKSMFEIGLIDFKTFEKEEPSSNEASPLASGKKLLGAFAWTVGTLFAVYLLGFHIAIPLFSILFLRFHGDVTWFKSIVLTAVLYGSVYLFFVVVMDVELYEGILFGALPPSF